MKAGKNIMDPFIILFLFIFVLAQGGGKKETMGRDIVPEGMVLIPGGSFEMGLSQEDIPALAELGRKVPHMSEKQAMEWFGNEIPKHHVDIDPFYMDRHEVTNRQFKEFVEETGYRAQGDWEKYAREDRLDHPVVNVTWHDAKAYAAWAGKRLPTEAEWEYAARGGRDVRWFPWGDSPDPSKANYRAQGESFFAGLIRLLGARKINTRPVGNYEPNGFGLYDMCGNVSEWCDDTYRAYSNGPQEKEIHATGPLSEEEKKIDDKKVVRGGHWESPNAVFVRITRRHSFSPEYFSNSLGFRCAKSLP